MMEGEEHPLLLEQTQAHIRSYRRRWWQLTVYSLAIMHNAFIWITYGSIAEPTKEYYGISEFAVDLPSLVFLVLYIPLAFPSAWFIDSYGLRKSLFWASFLNSVGAWIRFAGDSKHGFMFLLIGQSLCAISQPVLLFRELQSPNYLVPEGVLEFLLQLVVAYCIAVIVGMVLGLALGIGIPPAMVSEESPNPRTMLLIQAISGVVPMLLILFSFNDKPPIPPSFASLRLERQKFATEAAPGASEGEPTSELAADESETYTAPPSRPKLREWWNEMKQHVFRNRNAVILLVSFGIGLAMFSVMLTLLNQALQPFGFDSTQSGYMGLTLILCGVLGMFVFGVIADYTRAYVRILMVTFILAIGTFAVFTALLVHFSAKDSWYSTVLYVAIGASGFFSFALMPVALELACEYTYPLSESMITMLMTLSGQILSVFQLVIIDGVLFSADTVSPTQARNAFIFLLANAVLAAVLSFFLKPEYKRIEAEETFDVESKQRAENSV